MRVAGGDNYVMWRAFDTQDEVDMQAPHYKCGVNKMMCLRHIFFTRSYVILLPIHP